MRLAVALIISALLADVAYAGINTQEKYNYYDVTGDSATELRASINRQRLELGKRYDALTTWRIHWQFKRVPTQRKCKITELIINTTIEYLLPRWPAAAIHPDSQLVASWQHYIDQLTAHEQHHGTLTKDAVTELESVILASDDTALAPGTCQALESLANAEARRVVDELNRRHRAFDFETDHGRRTGATFPHPDPASDQSRLTDKSRYSSASP